MNNKNIVLIGFMGCGKTTIGKELAKNINFNFVDTDCLIENKENLYIEQIFNIFGEQYFRKLEKQVYIGVSNLKSSVISTGGGCVKDKENIYHLKKSGTIIYLKATPDQIYENIKHNDTRPLLKGKDKLNAIYSLLDEREHLYNKYADIVFDIQDILLLCYQKI